MAEVRVRCQKKGESLLNGRTAGVQCGTMGKLTMTVKKVTVLMQGQDPGAGYNSVMMSGMVVTTPPLPSPELPSSHIKVKVPTVR